MYPAKEAIKDNNVFSSDNKITGVFTFFPAKEANKDDIAYLSECEITRTIYLVSGEGG